MPTGKVKWFDESKGFGFVTAEDGQEVFLPASALPSGVKSVKSGMRLEFGIAEGRRGAQALSARLLDKAPSSVKNHRKPADEMAVITEDLIKLLDGVSNTLRRGRYPDRAVGRKVATILRNVADNLDA
ncbi:MULTISPECIES: cold-shock protein [Micrococcaceae]|uniref:cold-shock protein n=1 Tax=unclassified Kocuria TaxID=2649579 RepID=UPI001011322F|nr:MULTISPECIES: cold shock domain-containing protein [unclassified Kocuria]